MQVIYGLKNIKRYPKPIVAMGVFDGVHLAHIAILKDASSRARRIRGTSIVLTFWPHPQKEKSLYSLGHRLRLIAAQGIGVAIVINFNEEFSRTSPYKFVKNTLVRKIRLRELYVGENFRFGKNAQGSITTLEKLAKVCHFRLKVFKVIKIKNKPVSSTCIRALIKKGNLAAAQKLLNRPVNVLGTVVRGVSLARRLGFPTANINPHHEVIPPSGVYAVRVALGGKKLNGICNIGVKPTFKISLQKDPHIELHIVNFKKNIYGRDIEIQFIKKIRNEKKFKSAPALIAQIKKDIKKAKSHFPRY